VKIGDMLADRQTHRQKYSSQYCLSKHRDVLSILQFGEQFNYIEAADLFSEPVSEADGKVNDGHQLDR